MFGTKESLYYLIFLFAILSSCNTNKFLSPEEYLLEKNAIKFQKKQKIQNKRSLTYELSTLYKQKPNGNFLFTPREWYHFNADAKTDPSKFTKWQKRVLGEPPAVYKEELAKATQEAMEYYLQYNGYFDADVLFEDNFKNHKVIVEYIVDAKKQYTIDTVIMESEDSLLLSVLQQIQSEPQLKEGEGLEGDRFEKEKERISKHLRNNGYAYFYSNYISPLEADTTVKKNQARVYLKILTPPLQEQHTQYKIGEIKIFPVYDPSKVDSVLTEYQIGNMSFLGDTTEFTVKPQAIIDAIALRTDSLYREEDYDQTNRRLSGLGVFRFVRIKYEPDTTNTNVLNFRIELTPNPRVEVGIDFELNYTNRSTSSAAADLLGVSISPSLRNRNLFKGAELLITNLSLGVEVNPSSNNARFWNTIDINFQSELYFPKFLDYLGLYRKLNKVRTVGNNGLVGDGFLKGLRNNATSRLRASYNFLLLLDFYRYNFFNASFGYDVPFSSTDRYFINHLAIDYLKPVTEPAFQEILDSNPFLERSFGQQLFVSLLFRDINYVKRSRPNRRGQSQFLGLNFEIAGAEIWASNSLYNSITSRDDTLKIGSINFSQYIKSELDLRYYKQYSPKSSFAARLNFGIARPFGFTSDVPYVKQFFVGGPNSIRAWAARGLGPGGYQDSLTFNNSNRLLFYQTGDLKLEFNLEYRFDIYWRLKGAIFLDGGNVWTIQRDPDRCGSQFLFSRRAESDCPESQFGSGDPFYKQIALGSGFGFRFDFTYFIFRIDMGVRLRNPFPTPSDPDNIREWDYWTNFNSFKLSDVNFNLGLGYPF